MQQIDYVGFGYSILVAGGGLFAYFKAGVKSRHVKIGSICFNDILKAAFRRFLPDSFSDPFWPWAHIKLLCSPTVPV